MTTTVVRPRVSLGGAIASLGLPRWTVAAFASVPVAAGLATLVQGGITMPLPIAAVLVAIAVIATFADEIGVALPEVVLGVGGCLALVPVTVTGGDRVALVIPWYIVFRGAALAPSRESLVILGAAVALTVVAAASDGGVGGAGFIVLGMGVAWLAGIAAREIQRVVRQMRDTELRLAEEAAREERRKLAREVHDVIAHSMTVTLLHLNGALLSLRDDPDAAEQALRRAQRVGRASLEDLRRTVRLLSDTSDGSPGMSIDLREDLMRLRDNFADEARIEIAIDGDADSVPPFIALTVYRIVQESLTNAVRHAPESSVRISVVVDDDRIEVRVENTRGTPSRPVSGAGRGLPGMCERAALVGGHLEAGPTKTGWLVSGWVPREAPAGGVNA